MEGAVSMSEDKIEIVDRKISTYGAMVSVLKAFEEWLETLYTHNT